MRPVAEYVHIAMSERQHAIRAMASMSTAYVISNGYYYAVIGIMVSGRFGHTTPTRRTLVMLASASGLRHVDIATAIEW